MRLWSWMMLTALILLFQFQIFLCGAGGNYSTLY